MAYKKRFDTSSAYGQLILLVFLPICILAVVGGLLVFYETMRASNSEQEVLAEAVLIRYKPAIVEIIPELLKQPYPQQTTEVASQQSPEMSAAIQEKLSIIQSEQHVQRIAIVNDNNQVLATVGYAVNKQWPQITADQNFMRQESTAVGTAYGLLLGDFEDQKLWLLIDMDNEPLYLARYRIAMALAITGLLTILILLLTLNIYAKRWIAPIYELRLQLQRTTVDNLYKPILTESNGELNLLQQDLVRTLRRLHSSFQELQNHAEQTEDDLRLAFDEMEMQNISIRNARDAAISTSQAKSAFLANISHELRTPLNSIDGFINLLARHGELNPEQDLYVQTIRKSSAHLLALVNDVLDFSKIEAGKLVLDRHEFDLYSTIYDVVDMLSPVSAEKSLRMAVLFYNDVPMQIVGDALRLKQVLTNIVGNAIKFTDNGDVVVRVSLDDYQDNYLMISVQDSGKGISNADQKMLFQSFSQGDPSITRQYGGTGLGLVISKQLTRLMGGDIGFYDNAQENIANKGATFWFRMPTHVNVLESAGGHTIPLPVLAPLASASDEFNMLVWINHTASLQVLKASLQTLPIKLTQANSLPGVLESLKEQDNYWDWVIVDNDNQDDMMALLKQIRLHYQGKLAVFGYQVAADQALLNRYHANILYEPLDKRQLYAMLDSQSKKALVQVQEPRWQGVTVLAVDDHLPNLLVLDALLSELGIQVITANSGFEAIELISKQQARSNKTNKTPSQSLLSKTQRSKAEARAQITNTSSLLLPTTENSVTESGRATHNDIDLIFMDIQMPRMSGREATEQIRKIEATDSHIPIIALTAHGLSDERDKLIASGIDDYVGKPISQPQLLQVLQKWLGRATTTRNSGNSPKIVTSNNDNDSEFTDVSFNHGAFTNDFDANLNDSSFYDNKTTQLSAEKKGRRNSRSGSQEISMAESTQQNAKQNDKKVLRPLSLKKIRDDYLRDNVRDSLRDISSDDLSNNQSVESYGRNTNQARYRYLDQRNLSQTPLVNKQLSRIKIIDSADNLGDSKERSQQSFIDDVEENSEILDWQDALTRSANKPDLAAKLIVMMIDTIADEKEGLTQAWQAKDRSTLAQISHRILGASRYTGVPQLRLASQNLEDKCLLNVQHTTPAQFAMLKPYYEDLILALNNLQNLDLASYSQLNYHCLSENDMNWKMI